MGHACLMTENPPTGPALTSRQAAEYCGISVKTLRNLLSAGDGPRHWKHGRLNAFFAEDLDEWLRQRLTPGG